MIKYVTPPGDQQQIEQLIQLALREDIGPQDITTAAVYSKQEKAVGNFIAKQDGIIAGIEIARTVFARVDETLEFVVLCTDGGSVSKGTRIAYVSGAAGSILTAERTVLNFMQRMSGIATQVQAYARAVEHTRVKVLDTRKTIPGNRLTDKWAVLIGGGQNHRIGLYDRYLIKENHIAVAGGVGAAINACLQHRETLSYKPEIEIEVTSVEELDEALMYSADIDYIMLDNMSNQMMHEAVRRTNGRCKLEASGNVTLENIAEKAETGVDYISVGALTHSVKAMDISLVFE